MKYILRAKCLCIIYECGILPKFCGIITIPWQYPERVYRGVYYRGLTVVHLPQNLEFRDLQKRTLNMTNIWHPTGGHPTGVPPNMGCQIYKSSYFGTRKFCLFADFSRFSQDVMKLKMFFVNFGEGRHRGRGHRVGPLSTTPLIHRGRGRRYQAR